MVMRGFRDENLADRRDKAAKAKQAQLEKVRAMARDNAPGRAERGAARAAVSLAREARLALRVAEKQAAAGREAREKAAAEAARIEAETLSASALKKEKADHAAREIALNAERKAARDERYAARKKRRR